MLTGMTVSSSLIRPTESHGVNGLIHGFVVNAIVITLMLLGNYLNHVSQIQYTLIPFTVVVNVLCLGSVLGSGFVPTHIYVNRMIGVGTLPLQYLLGLIGAQYVGWGMAMLELTAQMNMRSAQISGAHYGGSVWSLLIIGLMPMVIPYAGADFAKSMKFGMNLNHANEGSIRGGDEVEVLE